MSVYAHPRPLSLAPPQLGFMRMVDSKDVHGNTVQLLDMGKMDQSQFTPMDMARIAMLLSLSFFSDDEAQLHGVTYVETLEGFTFAKAMKVAKTTGEEEQKKVLNMGLDTFPIRIRALYILHQPSFFSVFWGMVSWGFVFFLRILRRKETVTTAPPFPGKVFISQEAPRPPRPPWEGRRKVAHDRRTGGPPCRVWRHSR